MRSLSAALLLAVLLGPLPASAGHFGPEDAHAYHVVGLLRPENVTQPIAQFDRSERIAGLPQGEGGGPVQETFAAYERTYLQRSRYPSNLTLTVAGARTETAYHLDVDVSWRPPQNATQLTLVEAVARPDSVLLELVRFGPSILLTNTTHHSFEVPIGPGRTVYLILATHENVEQVAVLDPRQEGRTVQAGRAVLVELQTGSSCATCPVALAALNALVQSVERAPAGHAAYSSPWPTEAVASAAVGAIAVAALWPRPRAPKPEARDG